MDEYIYGDTATYNYSLTDPKAIGETTKFQHILVINNKVYADKDLCGIELDAVLQTLKQRHELKDIKCLLDRANMVKTEGRDNIFKLRDKYIKQEYLPRTDSFHMQSIALMMKNYMPLCLTTVMMEDITSLSDYLSGVLGFFKNSSMTKEEFEKMHKAALKDISFGDYKRLVFIYQVLTVFLNLYELLYLKICGEEADNLKCIGEIIDDRYFLDARDVNNENGKSLNLFSYELKNTRFDFMLHHEYDLYKNFTYSTSGEYEDKPVFTRPSYMKDVFLIPDGKIEAEEGDDLIIRDFNSKKEQPVINFSHLDPGNKYWYYKILLDKGISGPEIRKREILGYNCRPDLSCEDILNNLKGWFTEINKMLKDTAAYPYSTELYGLYSEIIDMINSNKASAV
ncbi:MAG: hypothetical protein LUD81_11380 [Clostridiales bacterium]|nr:hypothetical protein [Clostridiales bacterium]